MLRKIFVGAFALLALTGIAQATETLGSKYYAAELFVGTKVIIDPTLNVNGAEIKTFMIQCSTSNSVYAIPPGTGTTPIAILACNSSGTANGGYSTILLPYSLKLPAGWGVTLYAPTGSNYAFMTYDLNSL